MVHVGNDRPVIGDRSQQLERTPDRELMLVQFPHPGSEHRPGGALMDWNRREHARKFLTANGCYIVDGVTRCGPFAFWGEWEPQSRVVEIFPPDGDRPRWLHRPFWRRPSHRAALRNTDPLVFGDSFLYSNCRQRWNAKLRRLAPGSIVLFGSKLGRAFVLDTVFVVGDLAEDYTRASARSLDVEDWVQAVVFEPLDTRGEPPGESFRLYRGRTHDETPDGPFSFVPCRPIGTGDVAFARPTLRLDRRWIEPNLAMGARATVASASELRSVWDDVAAQVVDGAGLALGIALERPDPLVDN